MENCLSCHLTQNVKPEQLVYRSEFWQVELYPDQQYLGRCVVALRRHVASLGELTAEEGADFMQLVRRFESAVTTVFTPTHFNWSCLLNDMHKPGSQPMHVHWHVMPRYDDSRTVNGHEFTDHDWPNMTSNPVPFTPDVPTLITIRDTLSL